VRAGSSLMIPKPSRTDQAVRSIRAASGHILSGCRGTPPCGLGDGGRVRAVTVGYLDCQVPSSAFRAVGPPDGSSVSLACRWNGYSDLLLDLSVRLRCRVAIVWRDDSGMAWADVACGPITGQRARSHVQQVCAEDGIGREPVSGRRCRSASRISLRPRCMTRALLGTMR
jgi:hypothetical protein